MNPSTTRPIVPTFWVGALFLLGLHAPSQGAPMALNRSAAEDSVFYQIIKTPPEKDSLRFEVWDPPTTMRLALNQRNFTIIGSSRFDLSGLPPLPDQPSLHPGDTLKWIASAVEGTSHTLPALELRGKSVHQVFSRPLRNTLGKGCSDYQAVLGDTLTCMAPGYSGFLVTRTGAYTVKISAELLRGIYLNPTLPSDTGMLWFRGKRILWDTTLQISTNAQDTLVGFTAMSQMQFILNVPFTLKMIPRKERSTQARTSGPLDYLGRQLRRDDRFGHYPRLAK